MLDCMIPVTCHDAFLLKGLNDLPDSQGTVGLLEEANEHDHISQKHNV
jgi:hypothetical protein